MAAFWRSVESGDQQRRRRYYRMTDDGRTFARRAIGNQSTALRRLLAEEGPQRPRIPADRRQDAGLGELEIRRDQYQAFVRGRSVELTRREWELLQLFASSDGEVLRREEIYECLWRTSMERGDRSVDVFVRKLRQKLEKASPEWVYIYTHFAIGYSFQPTLRDARRYTTPRMRW